MKRTLKAIDLFSGCGGLTLGLKQAGFQVLAGVEIDPRASYVYRRNHPEVTLINDDIRTISPITLMKRLGLKRGELDLLAGCPPCQGFSRLRRKNKGRVCSDVRNNLIAEFGRFIEVMQPKMIMLENVPRLIEYGLFKSFCGNLKKLGYSLAIEVVDVSDFGVPQRRKRLVVAGSRISQPKLASPEALKQTVRDAIASLPAAGTSGDPIHDLPESRSPRIRKLISLIPIDGGSRKSLPRSLQLACHRSSDGYSDIYGRMAWDDFAPTITSGCTNPSKGRFLHPVENRSITLREASILQGFPSDYFFEVAYGKEQLALMIGNALPPPFIAKQAGAMVDAAR